MNEATETILAMIETARAAKDIGNDQARAASIALTLKGNDAMLYARLAIGPDPASIDLLDTGEIDPKIMEAHRNGPGVYKLDDPALVDYLGLVALSADESQSADQSQRSRFFQFNRAVNFLGGHDDIFREAALREFARAEREKILALPFSVATVAGRSMRVYTTDRGFAAAAWHGEACNAVLGIENGKPYLAVGSPPYKPTLKELGVSVDKDIYPRFGIVKDEAAVARVIEETGLEVPSGR